MPISKYHKLEFRMRMYAKESPWEKVARMKELAKHKRRCKFSRPSVDMECPHYSTHIVINRQRADTEKVLGGASNWIGKYVDKPKKLCDARPWRRFNNAKPHPAPFSTLKYSPRGDNLRVIEKNLMEMYDRIKEVEEGHSQYKPMKKPYLSRGDSPWPKPPPRSTAEDKLDRIKKWEMKQKQRRATTAPERGFLGFFTTKKPAPPPAKTTTRPASAPGKRPSDSKDEGAPSISAVTEEEAENDKQLAQLKAVQEAGDPHF